MIDEQRLIKVLIIDDDQEDFILTEDSLFDAQYTSFKADWASNYAQGLQGIKQREHDVYLVDYHLGGQTGLELIQEATSMGFHGPFILLTGLGEREIDIRAMEAGAVDFLVKGEFSSPVLERSLLYATRHAETLQSLRMSEDRYRGVLQSQTAIICRFLPDTTLTFVNDAYCRYFGKSADELLGQSFLQFIPEPDHEMVRLHVAEVARSDAFIQREYETYYDGHSDWHEWTDQPIFDLNGEVLEIQSVGVNITSRKRAEIALRSALQKERELSELKSRFVSMASHEFRTPLTMILSTASFLEMAASKISAEKNLAKLRKIQNSCDTMTSLLDEVLVYAKGEADRVEFVPIELGISLFCRELVEDLLAGYQGERTINIDDQVGEACVLTADEKLMRQILTNLLTNAVKYSPKGANVDFRLFQHNDQIVFEIQDYGIGIPEKDQPHLFEPFHRAANARDVSGTGLGLAITQKAVSLHSGEISFDTTPNVGTTFVVKLPQKQAKKSNE